MTTPDRREMVDDWDIARVSVARLGDEGWSCTWQIACALTQFFADVARWSHCCECAMGIYPHYGIAPHRHDFANGINTITDAPETWPTTFHEDPECPGLGTYECPRCSR